MKKEPVTYSAEIADRICELLSEGKTLREACREDGMPTEAAVRYWARNDVDGFFVRYDRARDVGCDAMFDYLYHLTDNAKPEDAPLLRIKASTGMWYLSKAAPGRFGERAAAPPASFGKLILDIGNGQSIQLEQLPSQVVDAEFREVGNGQD